MHFALLARDRDTRALMICMWTWSSVIWEQPQTMSITIETIGANVLRPRPQRCGTVGTSSREDPYSASREPCARSCESISLR